VLFGAFSFSEVAYAEHSTGGIQDASATAYCVLSPSLIGGKITPASALIETTTGETNYIDIERVRLTESQIDQQATGTLAPERIRPGTSVIACDLVLDADNYERVRDISQAVTASASTTSTASRIRNNDATASAVASPTLSALRIVIRGADIPATLTTTSSLERVRLADSAISADLTSTAVGVYTANASVSSTPSATTSAAGGYVKISSALVESVATFLASGREKWEVLAAEGET